VCILVNDCLPVKGLGKNILAIGERLKMERQRLGLPQPAMGALAGVTKMSQINYEKGERMPDAAYLEAIAAAGADVLYILTGTRAPASDSDPALRAAQNVRPYGLSADEAALLDNYRHCSEEARAALRATGAALAQHDPLKNCKGEK
jgi:transcriptional regulator with XRE-family HTH domain